MYIRLYCKSYIFLLLKWFMVANISSNVIKPIVSFTPILLQTVLGSVNLIIPKLCSLAFLLYSQLWTSWTLKRLGKKLKISRVGVIENGTKSKEDSFLILETSYIQLHAKKNTWKSINNNDDNKTNDSKVISNLRLLLQS